MLNLQQQSCNSKRFLCVKMNDIKTSKNQAVKQKVYYQFFKKIKMKIRIQHAFEILYIFLKKNFYEG